jgi:hypothetical protein
MEGSPLKNAPYYRANSRPNTAIFDAKNQQVLAQKSCDSAVRKYKKGADLRRTF